MQHKVLFVSISLIFGFILLFIGFSIGRISTTKKLDKYYSDILYGSSATELKANIKLLEILKKGEIDKAENLLESLSDVNLAYLSLYYKVNPKERKDEVINAISFAKKYREQNTQHKVHPNLVKSVSRAFELAH